MSYYQYPVHIAPPFAPPIVHTIVPDGQDLLIAQLQAEIFEIQRGGGREYIAQRDHLYTVQNNFRQNQDEKLYQDNDFNYRHDQNVVSINSMRKEAEDLRFLISEKTRSNDEYQAEIGSLRDQIARKEQECVTGSRDVGMKSDESFVLNKDADNLGYELAMQKQEQARDQDETNRLRDAVAFKERECQDNDAQLKSVDYNLCKASDKAQELAKLANAKDFELGTLSKNLDAASIELARTQDDHARLAAEVQALQRTLDGQLAQKSDMSRTAQDADARNRDMSAQLLDREAKQRATDDNLAVSRKEQDDLVFSNKNLMDRNSDVKCEIDAVGSHNNVLQGQNKDLNMELERFVTTDEEIRATLNRRDRVMDLRAQAGHEIMRSQFEMSRTSPMRR